MVRYATVSNGTLSQSTTKSNKQQSTNEQLRFAAVIATSIVIVNYPTIELNEQLTVADASSFLGFSTITAISSIAKLCFRLRARPR